MAIITKSLSTVLGIADIAAPLGESRIPLSVIDGKITRLPSDDHMLVFPEDQTFVYSPDLTKISAESGDKIFAYSGNQLSTITDESSRTVSTLTYDDDGALVSIVVTSV